MLLDYRPFNTIEDALTSEGTTIFPQASEIVAAGTLIQIKSISYPTKDSIKKRPLYSPAKQIWLYVRIAKERGKVTIFREKEHIVLVPMEVKTKEELKAFINSFMSKTDPHSWILQEQNYIQEAIWKKKAVIGMSKRDIMASLGPAQKMQMQKNQNEEGTEIWHYPHYFVVFSGEKVSKVKSLG